MIDLNIKKVCERNIVLVITVNEIEPHLKIIRVHLI